MSVPLPRHLTIDRLIWHYSSSGEYTVKSGYQVLTNELNALHPPPVLPYDCRFWKLLWSLSLPPKLRNFTWRMAHGFLPILSVLLHKTVVTLATCPVCSDCVESFGHCFFQCRIARAVWVLAGFEHIRLHLEALDWDISWKQLFFPLQLSKVQIAEIIFLFWRIWKGRCWAVHGGIQYLPPSFVRQFAAQRDEWLVASQDQSSEGVAGLRGLPRAAALPLSGILFSQAPGGCGLYLFGNNGGLPWILSAR
ncbi:unnamed protein product [Linum trigynum]|uniref:Reverse transcriptase zinc-binding domain-containing protein n=1 Tax=Linum trigynum TaxID=586398 RepID=A0AAV2DE71_9ROSI